MNRYSLLAAVFVLSLSATATEKPKDQVCSISTPVTVEHRDKVTVQTISFLDVSPLAPGEKREVVNAHVYLPDGDGPFPIILFSHSAIHANKGTSDLLPYAFGMAHAGAASIVLDRTIQREPYDEASNKDASVMDCASHWLVTNVKFNGRFGTIGMYGGSWSGIHQLRSDAYSSVGVGWMGPAERINTEYLLSDENYFSSAKWLARHLKLNVDPSWFHLQMKQEGQQVAAK
jgi:hypothetical protein